MSYELRWSDLIKALSRRGGTKENIRGKREYMRILFAPLTQSTLFIIHNS
jgi:hypothetical protein